MGNHLIQEFENALKSSGLTELENSDQDRMNLIEYGHFTLADIPDLTSRLCNEVAEKTGAFWTFTQFIRLQNTSPEKPIEPDIKDPLFLPSPDKEYPADLVNKYGLEKVRNVDTARAYNLAQKTYEKELKSYQGLLVQIRSIRANYNFDPRGYMAFIIATLQTDFPQFVESFFFTPRTLWINEKAREKHTFICAGTGSGKSESIKAIIRHYLTQNTTPSIVVLDPHDDLANDVARFKELSEADRLIYVNPTLFKGRKIAFNPFDTYDKSENAINFGQLQFRGALEQLVGKPFTDAQKALITPCVGVLLHKDGTSFADLVTFLDDEKNRSLVEYGKKNLPNLSDREFFQDQFYSTNFEATKQALRYRFYELVRDPIVRDFLCSESTFNFAEALDSGKVVCFGFDRDLVTKEAVKTIGQLVNAYLVSFAMRRPKGKRHPIHLFADECHYFVSPTIEEIMGETRKFGLYATLATQRLEQMGKDVQKAILGNVGTYLIGRSKGDTARKMGEEIPDLTSDQIRELAPLNFYQVELDRDPVKARIEIIGDKHALKGEAWRDVLLNQGQKYYRPEHVKPLEYQRLDPSENLSQANQSRSHHAGRKPMFEAPDFTKK